MYILQFASEIYRTALPSCYPGAIGIFYTFLLLHQSSFLNWNFSILLKGLGELHIWPGGLRTPCSLSPRLKAHGCTLKQPQDELQISVPHQGRHGTTLAVFQDDKVKNLSPPPPGRSALASYRFSGGPGVSDVAGRCRGALSSLEGAPIKGCRLQNKSPLKCGDRAWGHRGTGGRTTSRPACVWESLRWWQLRQIKENDCGIGPLCTLTEQG